MTTSCNVIDSPDLCVISGPYDINCTGNTSHNYSGITLQN